MEIKHITENKKQFLDLLLLGDEQEDMIDRYLDSGNMFALYSDDLKAVCVVAHVDDSTCELKNIAVYEQYQGQGYGKALIKYVCDYFKEQYKTMLVGTGETPPIMAFYKACGFEISHRIQNFFTDNYDHPIFDNGVQLVDMIYLRKDLFKRKSLSEMTNEELWQLFPIILSEYQSQWAVDYNNERDIINSHVTNIERISHIGSTAVPGLLAKPTIDILVEISINTDLDQLIPEMESMQYHYSPQPHNPAPHMMFLKGYTLNGFESPVYHVHVRYPGDWDEIHFRDYLIEHPDVAKEYGELKLNLKEKFCHDRDGYTTAKTEFVQRISKLARSI